MSDSADQGSLLGCDSQLPACANCTKGESECTFRDEAVQEDIPRSYIQSLNDRIHELESQISLHQQRPQCSNSSVTSSDQPLHVYAPGPGSDLNLDLSFPSLITMTTFETLQVAHDLSDLEIPSELEATLPNPPPLERSALSPFILRSLLGRYNRYVHSQYPILEPDTLSNDGANFKKLANNQKVRILMACAIAAAREACRAPIWKAYAQVCRDWASELISPTISTEDKDSLSIILLLVVYELADPTRGLIWELLDLATRTCLQLGWLHAPQFTDQSSSILNEGSQKQFKAPSFDQQRLVFVLRDIHGSLQSIYHRPSMMDALKFTTSDKEDLFSAHIQLYDQIYGSGRIYETQSCPCVGETSTLLEKIGTFQGNEDIVNETIQLFLPVCVRHKQCIFCFQEPDGDFTQKTMGALRLKVASAASNLIASVHALSLGMEGFISPFLGSARAFVSGCCIATAIAKRWIVVADFFKDILRCTEILTHFAPHWKGGYRYLHIWRSILVPLELS
uniref:Xylanolytic transcriptional activator regulatory domain-containing protein n=1 Tax=Bionectria ochroleuca TaxID=29856 RepID=A0A8H7KDK4_BIOOC